MQDKKMQDLKMKDLLGMRRAFVIRYSEHLWRAYIVIRFLYKFCYTKYTKQYVLPYTHSHGAASVLLNVYRFEHNNRRDALETVINSRKLTDAQVNPFTKEALFKLNLTDYAVLHRQGTTLRTFENKRKVTYIKSNTPHKLTFDK